MRPLKKLFGKSKSSELDAFQTPIQIKETGKTLKTYFCNGCAKELLNIIEGIFCNSDIYCSDCTKLNDPTKNYCIKSDFYEVFVYSYPWNPYTRAYAPSERQWWPTYQADTGGISFKRHVKSGDIPVGVIYASITLALSHHGSFVFYKNVPALIAINSDIGILCAYIPDDVIRNRCL